MSVITVILTKDEDDDSLKGVCYNDMFSLELETGRWHQLYLR